MKIAIFIGGFNPPSMKLIDSFDTLSRRGCEKIVLVPVSCGVHLISLNVRVLMCHRMSWEWHRIRNPKLPYQHPEIEVYAGDALNNTNQTVWDIMRIYGVRNTYLLTMNHYDAFDCLLSSDEEECENYDRIGVSVGDVEKDERAIRDTFMAGYDISGLVCPGIDSCLSKLRDETMRIWGNSNASKDTQDSFDLHSGDVGTP